MRWSIDIWLKILTQGGNIKHYRSSFFILPIAKFKYTGELTHNYSTVFHHYSWVSPQFLSSQLKKKISGKILSNCRLSRWIAVLWPKEGLTVSEETRTRIQQFASQVTSPQSKVWQDDHFPLVISYLTSYILHPCFH